MTRLTACIAAAVTLVAAPPYDKIGLAAAMPEQLDGRANLQKLDRPLQRALADAETARQQYRSALSKQDAAHYEIFRTLLGAGIPSMGGMAGVLFPFTLALELLFRISKTLFLDADFFADVNDPLRMQALRSIDCMLVGAKPVIAIATESENMHHAILRMQQSQKRMIELIGVSTGDQLLRRLQVLKATAVSLQRSANLTADALAEAITEIKAVVSDKTPAPKALPDLTSTAARVFELSDVRIDGRPVAEITASTVAFPPLVIEFEEDDKREKLRHEFHERLADASGQLEAEINELLEVFGRYLAAYPHPYVGPLCGVDQKAITLNIQPDKRAVNLGRGSLYSIAVYGGAAPYAVKTEGDEVLKAVNTSEKYGVFLVDLSSLELDGQFTVRISDVESEIGVRFTVSERPEGSEIMQGSLDQVVLRFNVYEQRLSPEEIAEAQRALWVEPDGLLGPATRRAIRDYQSEIGLRETGELDEELVKTLLSRRGISLDAKNAYERRLVPEDLIEIQIRLGLPKELQTGRFDNATRNAIGRYEKSIGLEWTAELSEPLVSKLYSRPVGGESEEPAQ